MSEPSRLQELEQKFSALGTKIPDSPEKQALSLLHGMLQERWRQLSRGGAGQPGSAGEPVDVATLYRHAPKMEGPARHRPLEPGTRAPDFELPDANGHLVRLGDYRGHPLVLVFYPLDWSPGCSVQLDLYSHDLEAFQSRDARIVGISIDSLYSHGAWAAVRGIRFPLLADFNPKGAVASRYKVYRDEDGFSERALYVIDGDGVIRYSAVSPYLHHVPDIHDLFGALDRLRAREAVGAAKE